ncbi:uncharacterized protein EHS24_003061 [Apiotrichum porosum]|uniref:Uncharacterized protein n=1 Tax=Apiotrichum porosum TaxID=105984 RepID=A0A427XF80_9TREE|nr:uncharacterized protein EHS24_003061 [Apiotrichum porosum]RSH77508.1 hypothetical protein EHS24_003061 [Apiotrichum porosum]
MTAPHARDIPFDVLALICDNLSYSEDDNGSRATLSRLMRCSWACMEAAMPALYRQLVIRETTFHKLVLGIPLGDTTADPHSDNVARERKLRCLSSARTLVIDCWPVEWAKMVKRLRASLFPAVTSVTFTPTAFLEGVAEGSRDISPLETLLSGIRPQRVCISHPTPREIDAFCSHLDGSLRAALPAPLGLPSRITSGTVIDLRKNITAALYDLPEWLGSLLRRWELEVLNLHGFCLLCHLPRFHAQLLRVFPLDSYRNHPFSYTKTPGHDGFFQLQNYPNYWLQAAKQLNDFKRSGNTQAVELVGVGGNLELKCRCVVEYSQNILEIKERILESMEGRVDLRLPHWSDAQPCQCCGKVVKPGSDLASVAETKLQPPCNKGHRWMLY